MENRWEFLHTERLTWTNEGQTRDQHTYRYAYSYEKMDPDTKKQVTYYVEAEIEIPANEKGTLRWTFDVHTKNLGKGFYLLKESAEQLSDTAPWFQTMVQKAEQQIEQRDRLRKLFLSSDEPKTT